MLTKVPLTPSCTQTWKCGLHPSPWLWCDAMTREGGQWHHCMVGKEPSANQSTTQDTSPLKDPYIREKVNFFSSDASHLYEKNTWVTKPSCQAVAGIPSLHAPEKWEIAELYHSPWCAALHSQFLFMDYIFILKKGYMSITVYSALHWDITEHYQWGYNRSLSWNRKIQQFDLADGCVIRSQYPECY